MTTSWGLRGWGVHGIWGGSSEGDVEAEIAEAPRLLGVDVISSDVIKLSFSHDLANNAALTTTANYTVVNAGVPPVVVTGVVPVKTPSTDTVYVKVRGTTPGATYTASVANLVSSAGLVLSDRSYSALFKSRITKTDSAMDNLPSMYSRDPTSLVGGLLFAITMSDDLIGGSRRDRLGAILSDPPAAPEVAAPTAEFSSVVDFLEVDFTDLSTDDDSVIGWFWDFGDGNSATTQNPSHTYATGGAYLVTLTVTNAGFATDNVSHSVSPHAVPIAGFTAVVDGHDVDFTDTSAATGAIASWDWDYGDGTAHGTTQNPSHTYATAGLKTVTLTITDAFAETDDFADDVLSNIDPVAEFSSIVTGLSVDFTDESTDADGTIAAWDWDYGDGTAHGTTQHPTHVYATGGSKTVVLTVTDNLGGTDDVSHNAVPLSPPVASFTHIVTGLSVAFTDTSTDADGTITAWDWDYGDGSPHGTTQNPTYVYATAGAKTVTLTVTDNTAATDDASDTVTPVRVTPVVTTLTSGTSTTDGTTITTASISPVANRPIYAFVAGSKATTITTPTASGNSLTWVAVGSGDVSAVSGGNARRLTLFRAAGASPSAGAVTFDYGADTGLSFCWAIFQFASANESGTNGSGATVQATNNSSAAATSINSTLAALENPVNVHLCATLISTNAAVTHDADFAELTDATTTGAPMALEVQWAANQTVCTPTFTSTVPMVVSVEVKGAG